MKNIPSMSEEFRSFSQDDYHITKRELLYQGVFRLVRYHLRHRLFKNTWSHVFTREILERKSATAVLPYDPILDQVILIEQFRAGVLSRSESPWLIEVVAGIYDDNEQPADVAKRESFEEAGCNILDLYPICEFFVSPGGSNEYLHLFLGRVDATNAGGIYGLPDENEDIQAIVLPAEEAFMLLQKGKIKTSPAIICLQWLQLNRNWLRELWQTK
jgi:ADP-ribose pyrophosphatase